MMGQICHHFSWTLNYLLDYPDWYILQRMLLDSPKYDLGKDNESKKKEIKFSEQTTEDIISMLEKVK